MAQQEQRHRPLVHPKPKDSTVKQLYGTAFRCAKPGCLRPLYRMNDETGEWLLNSSVAHIHARSEGGPRWDPGMSAEENQSAANLLPLCNDHAAEIDDTPEHYPPELLHAWKNEQLQECLDLHRSWPVDDAQAAEIAANSFDPHQAGIAHAGATTVITAVRYAGLMIESARSKRRGAAQAVEAWNAVRDRANRMMPAFDVNGERVQVEPSRMETASARDALLESLSQAVHVLEEQVSPLAAELHAVQAAAPALRPWCEWVEDGARGLTRAAGRWPSPPGPDDGVLQAAMDELRRAAQALGDVWRGDDAQQPPTRCSPRSEEAADESDGARAARLHQELLERARPWSRVRHRPYDADLYEQLVGSAGVVSDLPELLSLLTVGLPATTRLAARVARNADDPTFRDLIVRAGRVRPLAVSGFLLKYLAITAEEDGRTELRDLAHATARQVLMAEQWQDASVWADNRSYILHLLNWTADFSDADRVRTTVEEALRHDPGLLPAVLVGIADWSEPLDDGGAGVARGPKSMINTLPGWLPTRHIVVMINEHLPEVQPADEDASERYTDDTRRYASQVLWLAEGNPSAW
ncbi:hypothetical protein [Streptomyces sp. NPDC087270]|uniref:hypothetical protein n=1 Tax=Streptomyces sp. NPDC087270 TaxID=3365774 RepID=UPI0037F1C31C